MTEMCSVCGGREATLNAPRGWDSDRSAPTCAGECLGCATLDGWYYLDQDTGTVLGVPYAEWSPTPERAAELAAQARAKL